MGDKGDKGDRDDRNDRVIWVAWVTGMIGVIGMIGLIGKSRNLSLRPCPTIQGSAALPFEVPEKYEI